MTQPWSWETHGFADLELEGIYFDCSLGGQGPCTGGEGGCNAFANNPSDPDDPKNVNLVKDLPFSPVTGRSVVFGYGLVNALAAVQACNPSSPKRWPAAPRTLDVIPTKSTSGSLLVKTAWLPSEQNQYPRDYAGYVLIRSFGSPLTGRPADGTTAPPLLGQSFLNGTVVSAGTTETSFEDSSQSSGLRFYSLFYYKHLGTSYFYSFGAEAKIVFGTSKWVTVTTAAALQSQLTAGLSTANPSNTTEKNVVFVESATPIPVSQCLQVVGPIVGGTKDNGLVYIIGNSNFPSGASTVIALQSSGAGTVGMNICGSKYLAILGLTIDGGETGLGFRVTSNNAQLPCSPACTPNLATEVYVQGCTFKNSEVPVWLENQGRVYLQNNVIRSKGACLTGNCAGIYFPIRTGSGLSPDQDSKTLYSIVNNTIDVSNRPGLRVHMQSLDSGPPSNQNSSFISQGNVLLQSYNNIIKAEGASAACVEVLTDAHLFLSNNNDFLVLGGAVCGRIAQPSPLSFATLAAWRPQVAAEKQSIDKDPLFASPTTGDYHLTNKSSPCINGGTLLMYDSKIPAVDFDKILGVVPDPRVYSASIVGGTWKMWSLGIDIGADEFKNATQSLDADIGYPFLRADANNDGAVNIGDAAYIINFLFLGGLPPICLDAADVNDDEKVDISDFTFLVRILFDHTGIVALTLPVIPQPYPKCGFDVYRIGDGLGPSQTLHCSVTATCPP